MQQPVQWAVGQLDPAWTVQIVQDNGQPLNLSGITTSELSFVVYNAAFAQLAVGTGTFSILSTQGVIQYSFATNDVPSTPGTYYVRIKVSFNNALPFATDYIKWVVQP